MTGGKDCSAFPCEEDPDCTHIQGKQKCDTIQKQCVACFQDTDCPIEATIDRAYRFCKNDHTCGKHLFLPFKCFHKIFFSGYQADMECSVFWYGAHAQNGGGDPSPELAIKIFPPGNNNAGCLKQCKFHHKKGNNGVAVMHTRKCPYHENTKHQDIKPNDPNPDVKAAKDNCYNLQIQLLGGGTKTLHKTMIWEKDKFQAQFQGGSWTSQKFRVTNIHKDLVLTTQLVDCT